jgi:tetratricopeptide (TPR) repeat protein
MMALCPTCHNSIESYPLEQQYYFKNNPYNLQNDERKNGRLIISQGICAVNTGDIKLIGDGPLLSSNGINLLEIYVNEINLLEITLNLYNANNENILSIKKCEWIKGNIEIWDIEFNSASKVLIIKEKEGSVNLKIDARNIPVIIEGTFWINGKLITFNKKGIHFENFTFLKSEKCQTEKWGIWHLEHDSFKYNLKENATLTGSDLLSGTVIELSENDEIHLFPKKTPYHLNTEKGNFIDNERLLKNTIDTISYFNTHITINHDLSDFKPYAKGIERVDLKLAAVFFEKKLARYYAKNEKFDEAIRLYKQIRDKYNFFYQLPNIDEGEILLEISKLLHHIGDFKNAKYCFEQSFICFTNTGNIAFRLLDFGNYLYKNDDLCYCGSGNIYQNCHKQQSILNKDILPSERKIELLNLPSDKEFKITIYFLKEHKTHWSEVIEEYMTGFEQIYCEKHQNSFLLNINIDVDVPAIIRLDCYELMPIIKEFILTKEGYKLQFD